MEKDYRAVKTYKMTVLETEGFILFVSNISESDMLTLAKVLSLESRDVEKTLKELERVRDRKVLSFEDSALSEVRLSETVESLFHEGYYDLAERLYCCYRGCQKRLSIQRMNKVQTDNRRKISLYFRDIKKLVHDFAFKNPYADVKRLGLIMKNNIESESNPIRKMYLCDKFTALKAAEMDALINISGNVNPYHEGYHEIKSFITRTSNPSISQVILYGRQADVLSTVGRFDEGEDLIRAAYVSADSSLPCVEITDMIYKNVVFKLSQLEKSHTEDIKKSLLLEASRGIWSLNDESEDMRVFWKRLFILRMAFCHLGIGKFCDVIHQYTPSEPSLVEAERLLSYKELEKMEHRRMMFYCVAKSRLKQWKGQLDQALQYIKTAAIYAMEGKYFEVKAIQDYKDELTDLIKTADIQETINKMSVNRPETHDDKISENTDIISLNRPPTLDDHYDVPSLTISFNSVVFSEDSSSSLMSDEQLST